MTAKTHLAIGCATSLLITQPATPRNLLLCLGISSVGSVISDIDIASSESKKGFKKVLAIVTVCIILIFIGDIFLGTDIIARFKSDKNIVRLLGGFMFILAVCIFGAHCPHRSFMHSLPGVILITIGTSIIFPVTAPYMAVAMCSHILIDMLNKKKIRLLYPLKKVRVGFNLCYSDGLVNKLMFYIGTFICVAQIGFIIYINSKHFIDIVKNFMSNF